MVGDSICSSHSAVARKLMQYTHVQDYNMIDRTGGFISGTPQTYTSFKVHFKVQTSVRLIQCQKPQGHLLG